MVRSPFFMFGEMGPIVMAKTLTFFCNSMKTEKNESRLGSLLPRPSDLTLLGNDLLSSCQLVLVHHGTLFKSRRCRSGFPLPRSRSQVGSLNISLPLRALSCLGHQRILT